MANKYWSFSCGKRGVNRVRVYERSVSPVLYIEWHWRGKRRQESLKTKTGHPVTDKRLAREIAIQAARDLKREHHRAARARMLGTGEERTVGALLERLHSARQWKDESGQARFRRFWVEELGAETPLTDVTPAMIEAAGKATWSAKTLRHYRSYIVGAYTFAETKLKWIGPEDNLSAVDLPSAKGKASAYALAEIRRLLPALESVDTRAGWIGHVCWQTGRRLSAVRKVLKSHVTLSDGHALIHFPAETDKAGKASDVPVVDRALELTRILMDRPGKYVLGTKPPRKELCLKGWLPKAEAAAGIDHVTGRGFHAIKRRYATETRGLVGREKQAGTLATTLDSKYVQDDLAPKLEVAIAQSVSVSAADPRKPA